MSADLPVSARGALRGVVCDDRAAVRRMLSAALARCGIETAGEAEGFVDLLTLVLDTRPVVAVLTLPLPGTSGLVGVSALRAAAPDCEVVVLTALGDLEVAAQTAGASALVREDDPHGLQSALRAVAERARPVVVVVPEPYPQAGTRVGVASSTTKPSS